MVRVVLHFDMVGPDSQPVSNSIPMHPAIERIYYLGESKHYHSKYYDRLYNILCTYLEATITHLPHVICMNYAISL